MDVLDEGNADLSAELRNNVKCKRDEKGYGKLTQQLPARRQPFAVLAGKLQIVIGKSHRAKTQGPEKRE